MLIINIIYYILLVIDLSTKKLVNRNQINKSELQLVNTDRVTIYWHHS
jgi:hypothetical protein